MPTGPERDGIWDGVERLLVGQPKPRFLDMLITSEPVEFRRHAPLGAVIAARAAAAA